MHDCVKSTGFSEFNGISLLQTKGSQIIFQILKPAFQSWSLRSSYMVVDVDGWMHMDVKDLPISQ